MPTTIPGRTHFDEYAHRCQELSQVEGSDRDAPIRVQRRISNAENQPGRDVDEGSMLFSTPGQWMSALAPSRKPIRRSMEVGSSNEEEEEKDHEEESRQEEVCQEEGFAAQAGEEGQEEGQAARH